jgi:hypothetical protein
MPPFHATPAGDSSPPLRHGSRTNPQIPQPLHTHQVHTQSNDTPKSAGAARSTSVPIPVRPLVHSPKSHTVGPYSSGLCSPGTCDYWGSDGGARRPNKVAGRCHCWRRPSCLPQHLPTSGQAESGSGFRLGVSMRVCAFAPAHSQHLRRCRRRGASCGGVRNRRWTSMRCQVLPLLVSERHIAGPCLEASFQLFRQTYWRLWLSRLALPWTHRLSFPRVFPVVCGKAGARTS